MRASKSPGNVHTVERFAPKLSYWPPGVVPGGKTNSRWPSCCDRVQPDPSRPHCFQIVRSIWFPSKLSEIVTILGFWVPVRVAVVVVVVVAGGLLRRLATWVAAEPTATLWVEARLDKRCCRVLPRRGLPAVFALTACVVVWAVVAVVPTTGLLVVAATGVP